MGGKRRDPVVGRQDISRLFSLDSQPLQVATSVLFGLGNMSTITGAGGKQEISGKVPAESGGPGANRRWSLDRRV